MSTREKFLFYPENSQPRARTFFLDWNVSQRLVNLYEGVLFSESPHVQKRLLNLARNFPSEGAAVSGFGASEPEVRPNSSAVDTDRLHKRSAIPVAMLEDGHAHFEGFLKGELNPKEVIRLESIAETGSPFDMSVVRDAWIRPGWTILTKAFLLTQSGSGTASQIEQFGHFVNNELQYRPSREIWVGLMLIAGTNRAANTAQTLLKANKTQDRNQREKNLWGASWDLFSSRLADLGSDRSILPELPRPFTFVTDDSVQLDCLAGVALAATMPDPRGITLGIDELPVHEYIEPEHQDAVLGMLAKTSEAVYRRTSSPSKVQRQLKHSAKWHYRQLLKQLPGSS